MAWCLVLWGRDLPGDLQEESPHPVLGSTWDYTLDITKYKIKSLGKSTLSLSSGDQGCHLIAALEIWQISSF